MTVEIRIYRNYTEDMKTLELDFLIITFLILIW